MSSKPLAVVLAENLFEDLELHYPRIRLEEAGFHVQVVGVEQGVTCTGKHGTTVVTDLAFQDVDPNSVEVLIVPGGFAPDLLRRHEACLELVSQVSAADGTIGIICHGGWVGISANIVRGKRLTSYSSIRDDLENAGAVWVDERCVTDGNLITAQTPKDLPAFMKAVLAGVEAMV